MAVEVMKKGEKLSAHFKSDEFACKCCGKIMIDRSLIVLLERLFKELPIKSITVNSGYRCAKHDKEIGGAGSGSHVLGYAADIKCTYNDGSRVPSSVICLTLERMGHKYGIGYRCGKTADSSGCVHVDVRPRKWYGDELYSMSASIKTGSFFEYIGRFKVKVIDPTGINIRRDPNGKIIGTYGYGDVAEILRVNDAHTWGLTSRGWIFLANVRFGDR